MQPISPQSISPSLHSKLLDIYKNRMKEEPVQIPYVRTSYIDINRNGKKDPGEELNYNQKTDVLLKRIVLTENDLFQLEKVSELIASANNHKDDHLNQMEAFLIARRALLSNAVDEKKIIQYLYKLESIYQGFLKHRRDNKLEQQNPEQTLDTLHRYLRNNNPGRSLVDSYPFDLVIDNQIKSFKDNTVKVGNCAGLTALYGSLAFRTGIPVDFVSVEIETINQHGQNEFGRHIFVVYQNKVIDPTTFSGTNTHPYKPDQIYNANLLIYALLKNRADEFRKANNKERMFEFLKKAAQLDPVQDAYFMSFLANKYIHNQKIDDAIYWLEKGIVYDPYVDENLHNLGVAYVLKNDFRKAIKYIRFAIRVNNKEAEYFSTLGYAYERTNQYQKAYESYQTALKLNPKLETAIRHMNRFKQKVKIVQKKL